MFRLVRFAAMVVLTAGLISAQPALTTIQDTLYRADGTRFSGTMFIRWNSFQAGDTTNIATANLTLPIVNGVLNVKLVPTTTATPGAQYSITYNSQGRTQFAETWAVPPSSLTLRVRDIRISQGTVVGPAPIVSPIQIGDVIGLPNALNVRPTQGVGFAPGRAAIINPAGQIDAADGSLGDCVRVDGTSGPCGGGSSGVLPLYADSETPTGSVDGTNTVFTLNYTPSPTGSLALFRNGLLMRPGSDYSISGNTLVFFLGSVPQPGDLLVANYRYGNPYNPLGSLTMPQVICSNVGTSTAAIASTQLATCTIPAGLLGNGDRIEVQFHFGHSGNSAAFTGEVWWGSTAILSRSGTSAEGVLSGRATFGIQAGGQSWDAQSWGSALAFTGTGGSATENSTANLTVSFRGQMVSSGTDSLALRNFTVVRYPAQSNP
jgi:hypothetical protein